MFRLISITYRNILSKTDIVSRNISFKDVISNYNIYYDAWQYCEYAPNTITQTCLLPLNRLVERIVFYVSECVEDIKFIYVILNGIVFFDELVDTIR